ncbi:MAG TPA: HAD family phosphatase [Bryobacteraceae bacterium]|jgi:putative hydrolase of the HAD superfamily
MMPYKAIIFDLGKVLIHFDFKRGYRTLEALCPYPAAEIPRRIGATGLVERFETGLIEPHDFVRQLCERVDLRIGYDEFCTIWSSIFTDTLVPESMLEGLAARYRMVLLSNTNALHFAMVRANYPLLRHFDELVLSYEVKAMKPQPAIFEAAVARAGCRPEECFYTDDIAEYVEAARRLCIDGVRFESALQLQNEMRARGIEWE